MVLLYHLLHEVPYLVPVYNSLIEISETGDMTTIDGFSKDGRIICTINGKVCFFELNDVKLV